jgi:hypothetical protein
MIPFAIIGTKIILKTRNEFGYLFLTWVTISPVLLSIPFSLQRRLVEGLWICLIVLSMIALEKSINPKIRRTGWIFIATFPTTIFLLIGGVLTALKTDKPVFRPLEEVRAFEYIADIINESGVVLSSFETGNALPAWAPVFVVIGHGPESADIRYNTPRIEAFYQIGTEDSNRNQLLEEFRVDYVFWGPAERRYGNWNPGNSDFLDLIYQHGDYQIYKVIQDR